MLLKALKERSAKPVVSCIVASLAVQVRNTQDVEGDVNIGVSAHGLAVFKERLNIYRWPWQKIIQFSYNRGGFIIKVRPQVRRRSFSMVASFRWFLFPVCCGRDE